MLTIGTAGQSGSKARVEVSWAMPGTFVLRKNAKGQFDFVPKGSNRDDRRLGDPFKQVERDEWHRIGP